MAISIISLKSSGISLKYPQFYRHVLHFPSPTEPDSQNGKFTHPWLPSALRNLRLLSAALFIHRRRFHRRPSISSPSAGIRLPRTDRWVRARRRRVPVRDGRPPDSGNGDALHQLRRVAEEHRAVLPPRRVVLQLPAGSSGESLLPRLQRHYSM